MGLTKTNPGWSAALEAALTAARRDDLQRGTNAAYVAGCVCIECRQHQQQRMGRTRALNKRIQTRASDNPLESVWGPGAAALRHLREVNGIPR